MQAAKHRAAPATPQSASRNGQNGLARDSHKISTGLSYMPTLFND